jgi:hypothetical protein
MSNVDFFSLAALIFLASNAPKKPALVWGVFFTALAVYFKVTA